MEVIVYSNRSCGYCIKHRDFLNKQNINFKEVDILEDRSKIDEFIKLGGKGTPFTIIKENGNIKSKIIGFNPELLLKKLNLNR